MDRKLTAILSADVEGYSRLMGDDEEATVKTLGIYREAMSRLIEEHQGRVVDSPGDNLLAEFTSPVNAVRCAVVIQGELRARNAGLPEDRRMLYRIGINLGDVIVDGDRIYGDGVNVAARVESLAEGGGICVSSTVYDQVEGKLSYAFDFLGEQTVKNIEKPVRVYAVRWDAEKKLEQKDKPSRRWIWKTAAVIVVLAIAFIVWHQVYEKRQSLIQTEIPSIAVLPFRDMSPEKDQEYFCEGIAEEILNALAQIEGLRVASRTSSFRFRDAAISTIGEKLNVATVLEGSVRKEGNAIRITAQLNNAVDDFHLWSKNYDRELINIFALQDEIAQAITQVLHVKLMGEASAPLIKPPTVNPEAYNHYLLGRYHWMKRIIWTLNYKDNEELLLAALKHFKEAIALDPNYALAYTGLVDVYFWIRSRSLGIEWIERKALIEEAANKAMALDPNLAETRTSLGAVRERIYDDYKGAEREYRHAIELNPKYAPAHFQYGELLFYQLGRLEEALVEARTTVELEPYSPNYNRFLGTMLTYARQYDAAIQQCKRVLELDETFSDVWVWLGIIYNFLKKFEDAKNANVRFAELTGGDKEMARLYTSLMEEYTRTGEPVTPPPELIKYFKKWNWITYLYAYLGHKEKTLELLEERGGGSYGRLKYYPVYDFIRSEPRFIAILQKKEQELEEE